MRLSRQGTSLGANWAAISCAALLAIADANNGSGRVIALLANRTNSSRRLQPLIFDSGSTSSGGVRAYRQALSAGAAAIVGPARSIVVESVGTLGAIDRIPQIGFWASSPGLSDASAYPYFSRTYPSDALASLFVARLFYSFGWQNVFFLNQADSYGYEYARNFQVAFAATGGVTNVIAYEVCCHANGRTDSQGPQQSVPNYASFATSFVLIPDHRLATERQLRAQSNECSVASSVQISSSWLATTATSRRF